MRITFTEEEQKRIDSMEQSYADLIKDCDDIIEKEKTPKTFKEYIEESDSVDDYPEFPQPVGEDEDGNPVYDAKEVSDYRNMATIISCQLIKAENEWKEAQSDEYKLAIEKRSKLYQDRVNARLEFQKTAEERHFKALGNSPDAVVNDGKEQIDGYISDMISLYTNEIKNGMLSAYDVRVEAKTGEWFLDPKTTESAILSSLINRHLDFLENGYPERKKELLDYMENAIASNPKISKKGKLGASLRKYDTPVATEKSNTILVCRPEKYVMPTDKISNKVFSEDLDCLTASDLYMEYPATSELKNIMLSPKGSKNKVYVYASINFDDLIKSGELGGIPQLTNFDRLVYNSIVSHVMAGQRCISFKMIYATMIGKDGDFYISDEMLEKIKQSCRKFRAVISIKFNGTNRNGEEVKIKWKESLIMFKECEITVNGQTISGIVISDGDDPILYKWAKANGGEIDTRDIKLLDVPGFNNNEESLLLKMYIYQETVMIRNSFDRSKKSHKMSVSRKITFSAIFKAIKVDNPSRDKKMKIKQRVEKCLDHWKNNGLILDYKFTKAPGSNAIDGVELNFLPELEAKGSN